MSDSSTKEFERRVENAFPVKKWSAIPTLVAVSGGPDSVALLRAMHSSISRAPESQNVRLIVGHVDHGVRADDSRNDADFVRDLAGQLSLEFHLGRNQSSSDPQRQNSVSEEGLRDFRYAQLIDIASKTGARYLAMGHNADDQVETILFRMLRGTGISGLAGIPKQRLANESITIVRPLLSESRAAIVGYLESLAQKWQTDASNADSKYTRNFLRNELIPMIKQRFPSMGNSLLRLGEQAGENSEFLRTQTAAIENSILQSSSDRIEIDCKKLVGQPSVLIRQFLVQVWKDQDWPRQAMTFQWWEKLSNGLSETTDQLILNLPHDFRFEKANQKVIISRSNGGE